MAVVRTTVEILDKSLNKIAEVRNLYPLTQDGMVLRYSKELSDYGLCTFRIATQDPFWTTFGDIVVPHQYHVRVRRGGTLVWSGAIIDNPQRNRNFVEVTAAEYEFYLDKVLLKRTSAVGYGEIAPTSDIGLHYRIFSTGTMAAAATTIVQEAQAALGANHVLNGLTIGTVENPNFPNNFSTSSNVPLTGAWNFSSNVVLQFDYQSVLYALKAFGIYAACDFQVTNNLVFNFQKFLGNKNPGVTFTYASRGNIVNYNAPRLGRRMINDYFGIAATPDGVILHSEAQDSASQGTYGLMQAGKSFSDVKDQNALAARLKEELRLISSPVVAPLNITLNEQGYPLGQYDIGDLVNVRIKDGAINYSDTKRVVGITVNLHNTGREMITVQTNTARPDDLPILNNGVN